MSSASPAPGREHQILQIDPDSLEQVVTQFVSKKKVNLESSGNGVKVVVIYQPTSSTLKTVLSFNFDQDRDGLTKIITALLDSYRSLGCKTSVTLDEDPTKGTFRYSVSREAEESKPRQAIFDCKGSQVQAYLTISHEIPGLKLALDDPKNFTGLFTALSKEFAFLTYSLESGQVGLQLKGNLLFKLNSSLATANLPEVKIPTMELPKHNLYDVIGQPHVVTMLRNGLDRITRALRFEVPTELDGAKQEKLRILQKMISVPTGYVLKGPSGVGKNYAVEAFTNELQVLLSEFKPGQTLLVESISPNTIRSQFWGQDEEKVVGLFARLRKGVQAAGVAVLFVDEADTLLGDASHGGYQASITNQFKIELNKSEGVILILNTNHPERVDDSIINRAGVANQLDFNYLNGIDIIKIVERRFHHCRELISQDSYTIDFSLLKEDKLIKLISERTGREVKQMLDDLFTKLADQEQYLMCGIPPREIPSFFKVDTDHIRKLILALNRD